MKDVTTTTVDPKGKFLYHLLRFSDIGPDEIGPIVAKVSNINLSWSSDCEAGILIGKSDNTGVPFEKKPRLNPFKPQLAVEMS